MDADTHFDRGLTNQVHHLVEINRMLMLLK
jgi:hypothetical protein